MHLTCLATYLLLPRLLLLLSLLSALLHDLEHTLPHLTHLHLHFARRLKTQNPFIQAELPQPLR